MAINQSQILLKSEIKKCLYYIQIVLHGIVQSWDFSLKLFCLLDNSSIKRYFVKTSILILIKGRKTELSD